MKLHLEKGIPIPQPGRGRPVGPIRQAVESMKVGDSIAFARRSIEADRFINTCKRVGIGIATRAWGENQTRIWRIK